MKYTLLTFHFDRGLLDSERYHGLRPHIDALESQAACLAQGIYILDLENRPEHVALLEETDRLCHQLHIHFLILTLDTAQEFRWFYPPSFRATLDKWDREAASKVVL